MNFLYGTEYTLLKVVGSIVFSEILLVSVVGRGRMRLMRRISMAAAFVGGVLV